MKGNATKITFEKENPYLWCATTISFTNTYAITADKLVGAFNASLAGRNTLIIWNISTQY